MKINILNTDEINKAIALAQTKRHTVNLIDSDDLLQLRNDAEAHLLAHSLPQSMHSGVTVEYRDAGPYANAYRGRQGATWVKLKRGVKDWFLVGIMRDQIAPKTKEIHRVNLTEKQQAHMLEAYSRTLCDI